MKRSIPGLKDSTGSYIKKAPEPDLGPFSLDKFLFDKQLKFVQDPRPYKTAVCSRRSGKTVSCAAHLVDTAIKNADVVCLYITLARNNAKKLIWKELLKINTMYKLGGVPDSTELSLTFPNLSVIYLSGAKDSSEIEKFRGLALKLCYIDECQSFRTYIQELIDDVLEPALLDHAGMLCLIGTPGPLPSGYFYQCSEGDNSWSKHKWTFFDNPFVVSKSGQTHQALLNRVLTRRNVTIDDPSIQREFYGKWALDSDSLWIKYHQEMDDYDQLPDNMVWNYILGIDLGFNDADALAVVAWSEQTPNTYLVEELVVARQGLTELVDQIKVLDTKYKFSKMVIDEGGLGKKLAEEMRRRHHLPVQAADKARKQENVAFLNAALKAGRFKARKRSRFAQDSFLVEVDRDKSTPDRIRLSDTYHSDIIDAVLYAYRESPAFTYEPAKVKPKWGSAEWLAAQNDEMFDAEMSGLKAEQERHNGGYSD